MRTVEALNGSSRKGENERAQELVQRYSYLGTGGSDAHFVSAIATCLTYFRAEIRTETDLVTALKGGEFRPVRIEETLKGPAPLLEEVGGH